MNNIIYDLIIDLFSSGYVPFGYCVGYKRESHYYNDNRFHYKKSGSFCPECLKKYYEDFNKQIEQEKLEFQKSKIKEFRFYE